MTPLEYLRVFRLRWHSIAAGALIGLLAAVALAVLTPPTYQSEATIFVTAQPPTPDANVASDANELSAQRMNTYVELLRSQKIADEVAATLGPGAPADLRDRITATLPPETSLLTVTTRDGTPDGAARLANLVTERFVADLATLERPPDPLARPPVAARIYQAAVPSAQPVEPRPALILPLGLLLGLVVGIGVALGRHALDHSVRSPEQLSALLHAPVLGTLARLRPSTELVVRRDPRSAEAEAFRRLRATLRLRVPGEPRVLLVTSARPHEGTTLTVGNLALAFADAGQRVTVLDANLRRPRAAELFGLDRTNGLVTLLTQDVPVDRVARHWQDLTVIPSGPVPPNPGELLGSPRMAWALDQVRAASDVVLIDAPAMSAGADAVTLAPQTDGVLFLVQHAVTTVDEVREAAQALAAARVRVLGAVFGPGPRRSPLRRSADLPTELDSGAGGRAVRVAGDPPASGGPKDASGKAADQATEQAAENADDAVAAPTGPSGVG